MDLTSRRSCHRGAAPAVERSTRTSTMTASLVELISPCCSARGGPAAQPRRRGQRCSRARQIPGCSASQFGPCDPDESPVRQVTLSSAFYMGRSEVTQDEWSGQMLGANPSYFQAVNGYPGPGERPVETVSSLNVDAFLAVSGMRLPTEAEWEYACRGGTTTAFHGTPLAPTGSNVDGVLPDLGWVTVNSKYWTWPRCLKPANGFGLHDMVGNVAEWVSDFWGTYPSAAQTDPTGPGSGSFRVVRGGHWDSWSTDCRSSARLPLGGDSASESIGFRVVRNP